jgi:hypothetical protein
VHGLNKKGLCSICAASPAAEEGARDLKNRPTLLSLPKSRAQNELGHVHTGAIPTELGLPSNFDAEYGLRLGENRLTGSVLSEVCKLSLSYNVTVAVDCLEVECDCSFTCAEDATDDFYYGDDGAS